MKLKDFQKLNLQEGQFIKIGYNNHPQTVIYQGINNNIIRYQEIEHPKTRKISLEEITQINKLSPK